MNIITKPLEWAHALRSFTKPVKYLVLHHEAGNGTVERIHAHHKARGYAGVGYHLFVTKAGEIYAGRTMDRTGAHCLNYNGVSIGICFQGNFEQDRMGAAQIAAGEDAVRYALGFYPDMKLVGHKELVATACPGMYFPLDDFKFYGEVIRMTGKDIIEKLSDAEAFQLMEKANRHAATLPPGAWAAEACRKGVASGLFTDGDRDGLVDNPMAYVKRQELAAVLDRAGLLDGRG